MAGSSDVSEIAKAFVSYYYSTFDTNRTQLQALYKAVSMFSFEGTQFIGADQIGIKLTSLPFQRVVHKVATIDAQPSHPSLGGVIILVTGQLLIDDESNPQFFSQLFQLVPEGISFWIYNDIFRLNYG